MAMEKKQQGKSASAKQGSSSDNCTMCDCSSFMADEGNPDICCNTIPRTQDLCGHSRTEHSRKSRQNV